MSGIDALRSLLGRATETAEGAPSWVVATVLLVVAVCVVAVYCSARRAEREKKRRRRRGIDRATVDLDERTEPNRRKEGT